MRLFFCLELLPSVRESLYAIGDPLRRLEARVAWVRAENLHVTMRFLGEVEPKRLEPLRAVGAECAQRVSRFELRFDRLGVFPNWGRPRVIWVGCRSAPEEIFCLQRELETALQKLGFAPEERFTPHVTLGRVKDESALALKRLAEYAQKIESFEYCAEISSLTLMESRLTPQGAIYTPVSHFALGTG
ncbi:MAG: RNA 2',3'-cyclic phosphodiesterase [Candidatus Bipolaricaulota bacterium]|nr:RNA 2',3'-cyclic phosphodiesterase [Candidatus Bipolaricaulota bacterium]MDW8111528.1 RNA 2',3'-cyclic phosphodiesterase [Candidatus Bipolaricaulota bacterium]MDW8329416.1 RNA 2',3'-cyclic phosphodiesterase [Candidatus Bipolaricaulota bacterium]